ncbi:MAG: division/cell wall cluster transcriptional repressor MraZ [Spirochaetaceae bacterium]|nr:division/cell wall cluster transcriptional repressor MraZ [Spirochaetaceae bacterium]
MGLSGIWGQFNVIIDDKGRMSLPAKIRGKIQGNNLILTKGAEKCLWLYLPEEWERVSGQLVEDASVFSLNTQDVLRRFISPAEDVSVDKAGRVKLSPSLMKSMGLNRDCYLLGMGERLEIWDEVVYDRFEEERSAEVKQTWEGFGGSGAAS